MDIDQYLDSHYYSEVPDEPKQLVEINGQPAKLDVGSVLNRVLVVLAPLIAIAIIVLNQSFTSFLFDF